MKTAPKTKGRWVMFGEEDRQLSKKDRQRIAIFAAAMFVVLLGVLGWSLVKAAREAGAMHERNTSAVR